MTSINTWFISDTHFGHPGILRFHEKRRILCGTTLEELNETPSVALDKHDKWLVNLWNSTVKKRDNIYILGDVSWVNRERTKKIIEKLHGTKFLIRGNHDKSIKGLENYFEFVGDIKEATFTNNQYDFIDPKETFCVEMCHYPMLTWNRRPHGTVMLHGHCHGAIDDLNTNSLELRVDAGLDGNLSGYEFINIEKLYNYFLRIRNAAGCSTFAEYQEWLMKQQRLRM